MKNAGNKFNAEDWDNFTHSTSKHEPSGQDLFKTYQTFKAYVDALPKADLVKHGWMKSKDDIGALSSFFFQLHADKNQMLFRKSKDAKTPLLAIWLSKARVNAELSFYKGGIAPFHGLAKEYLREFAQLSVDVNIVREVSSLLARKGIVLVFLAALPGMKTDGVVFKLASGNPAIALSLRYSRLDYFWFTLLHELAHVVLHMARLDEPICDELDSDGIDDIEIEANRLAKQSIVERNVWRNCDPKYNQNKEAVMAFAQKIHVHPSLVAGLLRKEANDFTRYSDIVNEVDIRALIFKV
jgi:HTH-type transcriptional regulator/antitoxin HigA